MVFRGAYFLSVVVELDGFVTLGIAAGAVFFRFMGPLRGLLFRVDFYSFTLFMRVFGDMQQVCIFCFVGRIASMTCIFCLVFASAALLGVGRQGRFSSLLFPDVDVTVGFLPSGYFRWCYPFVDLFSGFHALEHCTGFPVVLQIEIPTL